MLAVASAAVAEPGATTSERGFMNGLVSGPTFSFTMDRRPSVEFLGHWRTEGSSTRLDADRTQETTRWHDPASDLEVRCVRIVYRDFDADEWTVYVKNTGKQDSPLIENLLAMDGEVSNTTGSEIVLHHNVGSPANGNDYAPVETPVQPQASLRYSASGGRPSSTDMPYFNIAWRGGGTILVVGWPGQWSATFERDAGTNVRVRAGQELTHFRLHPGEEVRTPLMVSLHYRGDWIDGQNQWRRWMQAHGMPKPGGMLPQPLLLASSSRAYQEMIGADEAKEIMHIDRYLEERLNIDYWWMDAGWYVQQSGWPQVGTWEVDKKRFPNGFKAISDHAHAKGVKILVWFEPERVAPKTWLAEKHPEWLLGTVQGLLVRKSSQLGTGEPCVVKNTSDLPVSQPGINWPPHALSFHPGPKGEYSVVRYVAPVGGTFKIDAVFSGLDDRTTTDVHVLHNGASLADSFVLLNGQGRRTPYSGTLALQKGDVLDFVVGYGNGAYGWDTTGLDAVITGPDGKAHDAAIEYGSKSWSYGWLSPGAGPDSGTFRPYDLEERGGSSANHLLNLGDPKAWKWLVGHIDKLLKDNGIDLYRQDFNIDPLAYWRANDAPERQGITENKYIVAYLAYWDELRRRHPAMLIDSCASGGKRNDLETMRRAVPLWRSDYAYEPIGHQCMTYGISMWLPYDGTGTVAVESAPYYGGGVTPVHAYAFWSNAAPALGLGIDVREPGLDYDALRRLVGEWRSLGAYYYGDFYPLTEFSRRSDNWIGWQYDLPARGSGIVQAFRRPQATEATMSFRLRGLDVRAQYRVTVIDGAQVAKTDWSGRELMEDGLPVTLPEAPGAAVVKYELKKP